MPSNSEAYDGEISELYWTAAGGGTPEKISGPSTTISIEEDSSSNPVPFRDNPAFRLAGTPERAFEMEYVDWLGGTPIDDFELQDKGVLDFYPEGNAAGLRKWTYPAQVSSRPFETPIGEAVGGSIGFEVTGAVTRSIVAP